jgi:hypothetical protein
MAVNQKKSFKYLFLLEVNRFYSSYSIGSKTPVWTRWKRSNNS